LAASTGAPLGSISATLSSSADGIDLERGEWQRPDGTQITAFGQTDFEQATAKLDGGVSMAAGARGDASARVSGAYGPAGLTLTVDDIDVRADESHLPGRARYGANGLSAELRLDRLDVATAGSSPFATLLPALADIGSPPSVALRMRLDQLQANRRVLAEGV